MKKLFFCICFSTVLLNFSKAQGEIIKENISCDEALELIKRSLDDKNFIILDLRTDSMYNEGHLEKAVFYDVFSLNFDNWINTLDKNKTYLLYCNGGYRSGIAFEKMKISGFKNLYHLFEGISRWKELGYPVIIE